ENDTTKIGGETMPDVEVETYVVQVEHKHYTSTDITKKLRKKYTPIIARVKNDLLLLDFRTMDYKDINILVEAFIEENNKGELYINGGIVWVLNPQETSRASQMD